MSGSRRAVAMIARNLPEAEQGDALKHLQAHFTVDDLILMAWNDDTPGVLRALSQHESAAVRVTVARNAAAPADVLEILAIDASVKVAATANRNLMWRALENDETEIPPYSVEAASEVYALVNDRRWNDHVALGPALTRLLQDPEWNQNPHVIRNFYDEGDLKDPELIRAVGASNLVRTLIPALAPSQKAEALQRIADAATAEELLYAIQDNEAILMPLAKVKEEDLACGCDCNAEYDQKYHEDGESWSNGREENPDPLEWVRIGSAHCSDERLLAALSGGNKSDLSEGLAIANIRTRPHLQGAITRMIADMWSTRETGLWLAEALVDEALLDLPFRILVEDTAWVDPEDAVQRARKQFTAELSTITAERPQAWQTLFVLSGNYHGSAREMLAALRNL